MDNRYEIILDGLNRNEIDFVNLTVIRKFEENLLDLFGKNKLFGTTHTCIGQEAIAVGVMSSIEDGDTVFSNHRCHGHFIAYSHHPELLLKEIMGKTNSLCEGRGGSQHIHYKNFYTNGVQGGIAPNAVGAALSEKRRNTNNIAVVFLGDGTLGQGLVYESMNIASLLSIPILFVVENNGYAMSTKTSDAVSGSIRGRASAFGIESNQIDGNDLQCVMDGVQTAVAFVRENSRPYMLVCDTYRLAAHSKGDDFRDKNEIEEHRKHDPILIAANKLDEARQLELNSLVDSFIADITKEAEEEEYAELNIIRPVESKSIDLSPVPAQKRYVDYINIALKEALSDENTIIIGEDIRDPYGGAFKVTKGLSIDFPTQVYNMPISEAAIAGIAVGAALNGMRTIGEIMFGDFITLTFDQLLNHASKYGWVYRDNKYVPMILRAPMGGKRGYGPTHSQCLEKYIVGIPDVNVVVLSAVHNPVYVYRYVMAQNNPTVIIENKLLYTRPLLMKDENGLIENFHVKEIHNHLIPTFQMSYDARFSNDVTVITYGDMLGDCMEAAKTLMVDDEITLNILVLGQLSEVPYLDLQEVAKSSENIIFVEEGTFSYGIGSEIIARLSENAIGKKYTRIASPDAPIPNSLIQEKKLLPNAESIVKKVRSLINGK